MKRLFCLTLLALPFSLIAQKAEYDFVLKNGRVMDPETGLDEIRNVGVTGNRIMEISTRELTGKEVLDVSNLVVAPGFIDLHAHGQTNKENEFQMHDGVTTALELEAGRSSAARRTAPKKRLMVSLSGSTSTMKPPAARVST